jgi:hypothetical protein
MADARPTINARDLVAVLKLLPPDKSVLIVGPHGIGKSQIARQVAQYFDLQVVDRRLSQMTEGDMIGLPQVADDVTRFLPVEWFKLGCVKPVLMLLDEFNRAQVEIMNAGFQVVLDRELNGNILHLGTRVFACINAGQHYAVNDMDPALVNRFAIYHFEPDVDDWLEWAKTHGIDPVLVDFIFHNPGELRYKDLDNMQPLTAYPTPRGWEAVNHCLKHANMAPTDVCGKTTPPAFFQMVASLVGHPTAVSFTKFVKEYSRVLTAEDILDRWSECADRVKAQGHDAFVALLEKIGNHCKENDWTQPQIDNLAEFGESCLSGEDHILLYSKIMLARNLNNIKLWHGSKLTEIVLKTAEEAAKITKNE